MVADSASGKDSRPNQHHTRHGDLDAEDVEKQAELEKRSSSDSPASSPVEQTPDDKTVISFDHDDPDDPHNWPERKKIFVIFLGIVMVLNSTIGSSIASGATQEISRYFHVSNQEQLVLPVSIYLVGYVLGPLVFGPLSEAYGRKWVMIGTFVRMSSIQFSQVVRLLKLRPSSPPSH